MTTFKKIIVCMLLSAPLYGMLPDIPRNPGQWTPVTLADTYSTHELQTFKGLLMHELYTGYAEKKRFIGKSNTEKMLDKIDSALTIKKIREEQAPLEESK